MELDNTHYLFLPKTSSSSGLSCVQTSNPARFRQKSPRDQWLSHRNSAKCTPRSPVQEPSQEIHRQSFYKRSVDDVFVIVTKVNVFFFNKPSNVWVIVVAEGTEMTLYGHFEDDWPGFLFTLNPQAAKTASSIRWPKAIKLIRKLS